MRMEPPPSVPSASGTMPDARAAELPPLDPPGVRAGSHGLRVTPVSGLSVTPFQPNSGVVILPRDDRAVAAQRGHRRRVVLPRTGGVDRLRAAQRRPAARE